MSSMVLNMVGGGAKGASDTDAVLHVTVPTGSDVFMEKTGMSLTPTIWTSNSDNTKDIAIFFIGSAFFSNEDEWIVTATLDMDSVSKTIIISENKKYDMFLAYDFALMTNGAFFDNSTIISGVKKYTANTNDLFGGPLTSKQSGYYLVGSESPAASNTQIRAGISYYTNTIDITPYNYLTVRYRGYNSMSSSSGDLYCSISLYYSLDSTYANQCYTYRRSLVSYGTTSLTSMTTVNIDISSYSGPVYVSFYTYRGPGSITYLHLYDLHFKTALE